MNGPDVHFSSAICNNVRISSDFISHITRSVDNSMRALKAKTRFYLFTSREYRIHQMITLHISSIAQHMTDTLTSAIYDGDTQFGKECFDALFEDVHDDICTSNAFEDAIINEMYILHDTKVDEIHGENDDQKMYKNRCKNKQQIKDYKMEVKPEKKEKYVDDIYMNMNMNMKSEMDMCATVAYTDDIADVEMSTNQKCENRMYGKNEVTDDLDMRMFDSESQFYCNNNNNSNSNCSWKAMNYSQNTNSNSLLSCNSSFAHQSMDNTQDYGFSCFQ